MRAQFTDCPSRERAGWLCDSFFTARAERCLTGRSDVERSFLENYLLSRENGQLPRGMLPMCYPASHPNGVFIPNWAMWLVLELEEYAARTEDLDMVKAFRPRLDALISYLDGFSNEDGLLERLPSWVFVEWSRANEWVQDVNYPSNMLYARVLQAYDALYGSPEHAARAQEMREKIMAQSYDGIFFRDHAVRLPDGGLQICPDRSEAAQYYAFFTGLCTPETLPELWKILLADFGPSRSGRYEDVAPANAFVGDYMRLDLLCRYGETKRLLAEMRAFFGPMARQTGTLWENLTDHASLCHGFASYAAVWLCETFDPKRELS